MCRAYCKVSKHYCVSVDTCICDPEHVLINPDISAVSALPNKYWKCIDDALVEMTQEEKDAVDAILNAEGTDDKSEDEE